MSRILFLSYDGMTDSLGQSQVLPYLKGLSESGYSFHLISFEKTERYEKNKAYIQALCNASGITWHPQIYTKKPPLISTIKDVQTMQKKAFELQKKHTFSIVHCRSYIAALVGLKMKKVFGTKFLFDMRGFWADERVDGKIWNLKNPIFKFVYSYFKRKELDFLTNSDHIVSLTENGKKEILGWKKLTIKAESITVIPCCVDMELFDPNKIQEEEQIALRGVLGIEQMDFILGYVGSIGTWYMLDEMLDFFKILHVSKPNSKFLFVTNEPSTFIFSEAAKKGIAKSSIIITSSIHKDVPLHISLFSCSIFFIKPTYSKIASSPTKQGEVMAMEIPLICNSGVGDTNLIVETYQSGTIIKNFDDQIYSKAVLKMDEINFKNLRENANIYFSLKNGIASYTKVYSKLIMTR